MSTILRWVERNTESTAAWEDAQKVDDVLHALATKLDGSTAAASSIKRNRRILNVAMEHAVKHGTLRSNPLPKGRGTTPKTSSAADKRSLINPVHAANLLGWIWHRPRGGRRLHAFFATLYYTGPRPEEAVAMRVLDARLPAENEEDQWGELVFHTAQPKPGDLLFPGENGDTSPARYSGELGVRRGLEILPPEEFASPLGKRVYDLRHTCLTTWLNAGVPPARVAEWAGNSVFVLLATYARCISGQLKDHQKRIEAGGDLPGMAASSEPCAKLQRGLSPGEAIGPPRG
ncbi:hypothetical protein [Streptomyces sp. NPDC048473]|uniref:hypothetical protein n=1 Tax=unclassified Streptomyces TaxID=2593676 RepID=UPI00372087D6